MYIIIRMNKWYKIEITTAFSKRKYLASSDRKQTHYSQIGNYIKAQNMLRVVIYRDIQRVNCSYKHFVQ